MNRAYPHASIEYENHGAGGTTTAGILPSLRPILEGPGRPPLDLVLIDFLANDAFEAQDWLAAKGGAYTNTEQAEMYAKGHSRIEIVQAATSILLSRLRERHPQAALLLFEPLCTVEHAIAKVDTAQCYDTQEAHVAAANAFQVPVVSYRDVVWPASERHSPPKAQFWCCNHTSHPRWEAHQLMADVLAHACAMASLPHSTSINLISAVVPTRPTHAFANACVVATCRDRLCSRCLQRRYPRGATVCTVSEKPCERGFARAVRATIAMIAYATIDHCSTLIWSTCALLSCSYDQCRDAESAFDAKKLYSEQSGLGRMPHVVSGDWRLFEDRVGKPGWIAQERGATLGFDLTFGNSPRVVISFLRSYEQLGAVTIGFAAAGSEGDGLSAIAGAKYSIDGIWPQGTMPPGDGGRVSQVHSLALNVQQAQVQQRHGDAAMVGFGILPFSQRRLLIQLERTGKFKILSVVSC